MASACSAVSLSESEAFRDTVRSYIPCAPCESVLLGHRCELQGLELDGGCTVSRLTLAGSEGIGTYIVGKRLATPMPLPSELKRQL